MAAEKIGKSKKQEFTWTEVCVGRTKGQKIEPNDISFTYKQYKDGKNKMHFLFGENLLNHLGCKKGDRLMLLCAKESIYQYLLVKSPNGAIISAITGSKAHVSSYTYTAKGLPYYKAVKCKYVLNKNGTIQISLPEK